MNKSIIDRFIIKLSIDGCLIIYVQLYQILFIRLRAGLQLRVRFKANHYKLPPFPVEFCRVAIHISSFLHKVLFSRDPMSPYHSDLLSLGIVPDFTHEILNRPSLL